MQLSIPRELESLMPSVLEEYREKGVFFLDPAYLLRVNQKTNAFPNLFGEILTGAKQVAEDESAAQYALLLYRAMQNREQFLAILPLVEIPHEEYPTLALLAFMPSVEALYDYLLEKELPEDIVRATVQQFENCMYLQQERSGHLGMSKRYFDHMQRYVDFRILNVGRLRFEMHDLKDACIVESRKTGEQIIFPVGGEMNEDGLLADTPPMRPHSNGFTAFFKETEQSYIGTPIKADGSCQKEPLTLDKNEFFMKLPLHSACLAVHIPAKGALTEEACQKSYERALAIFSKLHPTTPIRAFRCHSWMMSPQLKEILKGDSNLLRFQAPYRKYPCKTKGEDVFNFVFKMLPPKSYEALPEETSLQRALKQIYLNGGYLYEYNGIFTV